MRLAKSILCGAAALGFAAGSALADESTSSGMEFDGQVAWNDSPSADVAYYVYDVDDDMDGRADRTLVIEQSDTLALAPSDAGLETPSRG
jgi:hypothetical protein